jgi:hypothetical protein
VAGGSAVSGKASDAASASRIAASREGRRAIWCGGVVGCV